MSKSSKYIGVSWNKNSNKWNCKGRIRGKQHYIGSFIDEEEAGLAYQKFINSHQSKIYSQRDRKYIRDNYLMLTDEQIGVYLNRTTEAVKAVRQRMGLYKDIEGIKNRPHLAHVSLWLEIEALRNYISLGKGGQIAIDRLNSILSHVSSKPRIHKSKRTTALSEIAKVYELFISGMSRYEISKETGHLLPTIYWWIKGIQGYKGRNKSLMVLDSRINLD